MQEKSQSKAILELAYQFLKEKLAVCPLKLYDLKRNNYNLAFGNDGKGSGEVTLQWQLKEFIKWE